LQTRDKVIFYLAAAVSDFYVPWASLPEHKLQSQDGALSLEMANVPKCLSLIRSKWASPGAFLVSFKLETDEEILLVKAKGALMKHNSHCVVANLLETRKDECALHFPLRCQQACKHWNASQVVLCVCNFIKRMQGRLL
jgi:phosphopantothenate---cysteine ligase (ATP)